MTLHTQNPLHTPNTHDLPTLTHTPYTHEEPAETSFEEHDTRDRGRRIPRVIKKQFFYFDSLCGARPEERNGLRQGRASEYCPWKHRARRPSRGSPRVKKGATGDASDERQSPRLVSPLPLQASNTRPPLCTHTRGRPGVPPAHPQHERMSPAMQGTQNDLLRTVFRNSITTLIPRKILILILQFSIDFIHKYYGKDR